jgi:ferric-dicitrate binding protein FerR (iron transport regulator)
MAEDEFYITDLLFRHFGDGLPKEEQEVLDNWVASSRANQDLMEMLADTEKFIEQYKLFLRIDSAMAWKRLEERHAMLRPTGGRSLRMAAWSWITHYWKALLGSIAVIVMTLLGALMIIRLASRGHYATLRLPDGSRYELATLLPGPVKTTGCITICKCTDSTVVYLPIQGCLQSHPPAHQATYNILSTPRGGWYIAILEDKSQVRLYSASSLVFPTLFDSLRREVYLQGEGYFDVSPAIVNGQPRGPFIVHVYLHPETRPASADTGMLTIVSLGRRFNVTAYPGEGIVRVNPEEDSLRLEKDGQTLTLYAGQAGVVDENGRLRRDNRSNAITVKP